MRQVVVLMVFGLMGISSWAQTANQALDQINKRYQSLSAFYLDFSVVLTNSAQKINQTKQGKVYSTKTKYHLEMTDMVQIYDGAKLYTISPSDKEVTIGKATAEETFTPTKVLNMYKNGYTATLNGKGKVGAQSVNYIKLVPTSGRSQTKSIQIAYNPINNNLVEIREFNKANTETKITIKSQLDNIIIRKNLLSFSKAEYVQKGYMITEL